MSYETKVKEILENFQIGIALAEGVRDKLNLIEGNYREVAREPKFVEIYWHLLDLLREMNEYSDRIHSPGYLSEH